MEIIAYFMTPDTSQQKARLLIGPGGNGKSRYLTALRNFLGRRNVSALSLHKLEGNTFAAANLVRKLANICASSRARISPTRRSSRGSSTVARR